VIVVGSFRPKTYEQFLERSQEHWQAACSGRETPTDIQRTLLPTMAWPIAAEKTGLFLVILRRRRFWDCLRRRGQFILKQDVFAQGVNPFTL
jgi:hypothetical protein